MATIGGSERTLDRLNDESVKIGSRMKAVRLARRMTIESLAESSGLTKSFLSKVERGKSTPSVAALLRIAGALDIPLANLFENQATRHVLRSGSYPPIEFGGSALNEFLLTPHAEQRIQVILSRISPGGGSGDESYELPGDVEFAYVIDGTLEVSFPDGIVRLAQGDAMTFEPTTPRSFSVPRDASVTTVIWVLAPALPHTEGRRYTSE